MRTFAPLGCNKNIRKHQLIIEKVNSWKGVLTLDEMAMLLGLTRDNLFYYIKLHNLPYKNVRNSVDKVKE